MKRTAGVWVSIVGNLVGGQRAVIRKQSDLERNNYLSIFDFWYWTKILELASVYPFPTSLAPTTFSFFKALLALEIHPPFPFTATQPSESIFAPILAVSAFWLNSIPHRRNQTHSRNIGIDDSYVTVRQTAAHQKVEKMARFNLIGLPAEIRLMIYNYGDLLKMPWSGQRPNFVIALDGSDLYKEAAKECVAVNHAMTSGDLTSEGDLKTKSLDKIRYLTIWGSDLFSLR
jgi:hypothetical protein